jgi:hypothetical protein
MMSGSPVATFRDPAGSLSFEDRVVRNIHSSSREAVLEFVESSFFRRHTDNGDLIAETVEDLGGRLRLLPPRRWICRWRAMGALRWCDGRCWAMAESSSCWRRGPR